MYKALTARGLIRYYGEMTTDLFNSTPLKKCFEQKNDNSAKILLSYLMKTKSFDNNHFDIVMKSFDYFMKCSSAKEEMLNFLSMH